MVDLTRRRPIGMREFPLAKQAAGWLAKNGVTPNQISLAGLAYAVIGGIALGFAGLGDWGARPALYLIGALMIELRLLCNILDGMVAVEGGKGTPDGELYNEMPDRLADCFVLIGAGCATASLIGVVAGFLAALFALMTAYVRALGSSMGLPADFSGPLAKPQRMQAVAAACIIAALLSARGLDHALMIIAAILIALGTAATVALRTRRLSVLLRTRVQ